jgi:hypothetical protein
MDFQPLPTPFQPYAIVGAIVPTNPLPTPAFAHPHTPKGGTHPFEGVAHPSNAFDLVPMPPFCFGGSTVGVSHYSTHTGGLLT